MNNFEAIRTAECDDCGELNSLNEFGLCQSCNEVADAFNKAAQAARMRGHDPYKAGMIAQAEMMRKKSQNPAILEALNEITKGIL